MVKVALAAKCGPVLNVVKHFKHEAIVTAVGPVHVPRRNVGLPEQRCRCRGRQHNESIVQQRLDNVCLSVRIENGVCAGKFTSEVCMKEVADAFFVLTNAFFVGLP